MKSNISNKEINSGKDIIDLLKQSDPLLSPHILKKNISEYKKFFPNINQYGIWFSQNTKIKTSKKYDKIIFLLNGLAASGKDSIFNKMITLNPNLFFKTVTATSRLPREKEVNGIDYYFYKNISSFKTDIQKKEFIEYLKRGDSYYGLPKKSFDYAFKQLKPIIYCQIEMSGWNNLEHYISSLNKNVLIIKAFILPHMNLYQYLQWLTQNRGKEEITSRINKSGWELKIAPKKVDFLIINRIKPDIDTLTITSKTIINLIIPYLKNSKIKKYSTPTDKLKFTKNISNIVKIHDSIV
jgi:guanylate kinase